MIMMIMKAKRNWNNEINEQQPRSELLFFYAGNYP